MTQSLRAHLRKRKTSATQIQSDETKLVFMIKNYQPTREQAWSFEMLSFETMHIQIVKGICSYICCIAAYNSALPIQNGTCKWFRIAIVSVDSFADHSMLRFPSLSQLRGGNESVMIMYLLSVRANRLSVCCRIKKQKLW